jgi:hypothetical protein
MVVKAGGVEWASQWLLRPTKVRWSDERFQEGEKKIGKMGKRK